MLRPAALVPTGSGQARRLALLRGPDRWWKAPVVVAFARSERFDVPRLEETLRLLARRHRGLRTYFVPGGPVEVAASLDEEEALWPLEVTVAAPGDRGEAVAAAWAWLRRDFDPFEPPLVRALLLRRAGDDLLGLSVDHTVFDGDSAGVLLRDLARAYENLERGDVASADVAGSDAALFARLEREWLEAGAGRAALAYWDRVNEGLDAYPRLGVACREDPPLDAPSDFRTVRLDEEDVRVIARTARELRISEFMLFAAAAAATLRERAGGDDVAFLFSNSRRVRRSTRAVVGYLANRSLLRIAARRGEPVVALAGRVRAATVDAVAHGMLTHDHFVRTRFPDAYERKPRIPHLLVNVVRQKPLPDIAGARCVPVDVPPRPEDRDPPGLRLILGFHAGGTASLMSEHPQGLYDPGEIEEMTGAIVRRCLRP